MKTIALLSAGVAAMIVPLLPADPAQAALRTWVSGTGSNVAPCTRAAPCATFLFAINSTDPGGSINCVDAGDYGGLVINKSITIDCTGTFAAASVTGFSAAITVDGAGIFVTLRGLSIEGFGIGAAGINVLQASVVQVEQCRISGFKASAGGIRFHPSGGGNLFVSDTVITNNGAGGASDGGIIVTGSAQAVLNRVQVENNFQGILVDGTGSTGVILVEVRDSVVAGNAGHGIAAISSAGHSPTGVVVDRTSSAFNAASGILAQGATVHLGNSTVTGNTTGLNVAGGGQILSYQNNQTSGNFTDGAPTGVLTL
jgi:hypothetical protein